MKKKERKKPAIPLATKVEAPSEWRWTARAIIVLVALLTFGRAATYPFYNWDDQLTIAENPRLNPPSMASVGHYWGESHLSLYIPVTYTYWNALAAVAWDEQTQSLSPFPFHAGNVVLHALSALLAFEILLRLTQRSAWPSLIGAGVFALHPVQVESVAWTSGAKDVLSGMLALASIWLHLHAADEQQRRRTLFAIGSLVAYALAMLSKPAVVTLPLIIAAIDFFFYRARFLKLLPWIGVMLLMAIPIVVIGKNSQPAALTFVPPLWQRPAIAGESLVFYLRHILFPYHLMVDYGHSPQWVLAHPWARWAWIIVLLLAAALWNFRKRIPWLIAGVLIFVGGVFPVLGFVPFEYQLNSTVTDHYLYLAMLGPALIAAMLTTHARQPIFRGILFILVAALGVRSVRQLSVWRDTETLFTHNLNYNDTSLVTLANLAYIAEKRGDTYEAVGYYEITLQMYPNDARTWFNYGSLYLRQKNPQAAAMRLRRSVELSPNVVDSRINLAAALVQLGQLDEAIAHVEHARSIAPDLKLTQDALAKLYELKRQSMSSPPQ